jgi:hypothetical protein
MGSAQHNAGSWTDAKNAVAPLSLLRLRDELQLWGGVRAAAHSTKANSEVAAKICGQRLRQHTSSHTGFGNPYATAGSVLSQSDPVKRARTTRLPP